MNHLSRSVALLGAVLQLALPMGLVAVQLRLLQAVGTMDLGHAGQIDEVKSSLARTTALLDSAWMGLWIYVAIALVGTLLFMSALVWLRCREKWAFWFAVIYGGCLTCMVPVGTLWGLGLLIYAVIHRAEFGMQSKLPLAQTTETLLP